ncbi:MAG TPA: hypothetical protein VNM92_10250 [Thermoanaerobaculia bacterium]|nr:hypothetical protein [Thermoanaerobaculia bacterium]
MQFVTESPPMTGEPGVRPGLVQLIALTVGGMTTKFTLRLTLPVVTVIVAGVSTNTGWISGKKIPRLIASAVTVGGTITPGELLDTDIVKPAGVR